MLTSRCPAYGWISAPFTKPMYWSGSATSVTGQPARVDESGIPLGIVQRDQHADLRQPGVDDRRRDLHPVALTPMRAGDDHAAGHGGAHLLYHRRAAHDAGGAQVDLLNQSSQY